MRRGRRVWLVGLVVLAAGLVAACRSTTPTARRSSARTGSGPSSTTTTLSPNDIANDVYAHTRPVDLADAVRGIAPRVYVPNSEAATVDVIDPATFQVVRHFDVGINPQHVTPSWDLKTLYVDNDMSDTLTPIDARTGARGADIPVPDPYNLYFTVDGTKAIVVAERLHRLDFRDPHTWQLIKSVPIAHNGVDHIDFNADGRYLIASCEFSGYVVKVDVQSMTVVGDLDVGGEPIDVKLSPDGKVFYVANQKRNGVSIVDGETMRELAFVPTGKGAHGLYPDRQHNRLFVSNRLEGTVSVMSFSSRSVIENWYTGGSPDMGGVSTDGTQLWLSGRYDQAVYVINTATGALLKKIDVGVGPHGLDYFPQPGRYSLGHTGVYR
jgi:YVTN family beta-propeller protein